MTFTGGAHYEQDYYFCYTCNDPNSNDYLPQKYCLVCAETCHIGHKLTKSRGEIVCECSHPTDEKYDEKYE